MSKILAVFGATGHQGSSLINHVLKHPILSKVYTIRALTRTPNSPKALALANHANVQVMTADVNDLSSVSLALRGIHTVFLMTVPFFTENGEEDEFQCARGIADIAKTEGVEMMVFSTLPSVREISGGVYGGVWMFEAKKRAEVYIRELEGMKSAFFSAGFFMENFAEQPFLAPQPSPSGDGTYILARPCSPTTRLPYLASTHDSGAYICTVLLLSLSPSSSSLLSPNENRYLAAQSFYTFSEIASLLSKSSGKTVIYQQVTDEEFRASLIPVIGPGFAEVFSHAFAALERWGYFGIGGEEECRVVRERVEEEMGKLMGLDEFFEENPVVLG